jgi:hypothetical protein
MLGKAAVGGTGYQELMSVACWHDPAADSRQPVQNAKNSNRAYRMATDTQVLVVGAGPVGLFMAAELNRHGVSCRIVDKNEGPTHDSRAASIQARTLEILESISLADEFVQVGNILPCRSHLYFRPQTHQIPDL